MAWDNDIRARFPDWKTPAGLARWQSVRQELSVGKAVIGEVIARAPFGVWIDIGAGFPALLLVPEMEEAHERRITFDDYPAIGSTVDSSIGWLGDGGAISLTQHRATDGK
jgi:hypothetical protein